MAAAVVRNRAPPPAQRRATAPGAACRPQAHRRRGVAHESETPAETHARTQAELKASVASDPLVSAILNSFPDASITEVSTPVPSPAHNGDGETNQSETGKSADNKGGR